MRLDHLLSKETESLHYEFYGELAQLGEHLPCKQGVKGSIPLFSTIAKRWALQEKESSGEKVISTRLQHNEEALVEMGVPWKLNNVAYESM